MHNLRGEIDQFWYLGRDTIGKMSGPDILGDLRLVELASLESAMSAQVKVHTPPCIIPSR